ncbi:MAG: Uncharacterized hydrolase DSY2054, partial [uncultured Gemmatimonadetes bacterium]
DCRSRSQAGPAARVHHGAGPAQGHPAADAGAGGCAAGKQCRALLAPGALRGSPGGARAGRDRPVARAEDGAGARRGGDRRRGRLLLRRRRQRGQGRARAEGGGAHLRAAARGAGERAAGAVGGVRGRRLGRRAVRRGAGPAAAAAAQLCRRGRKLAPAPGDARPGDGPHGGHPAGRARALARRRTLAGRGGRPRLPGARPGTDGV